jgi:hypothetical protein
MSRLAKVEVLGAARKCKRHLRAPPPVRAPPASPPPADAAGSPAGRGAHGLDWTGTAAEGGLWQQQGRRAEAYDLLTPIYGWFTEGFDTADLQEARWLLEQLSGERGQVGTGD